MPFRYISTDLPFSFCYDVRPSGELLGNWTVSRQSEALDDGRIRQEITRTDPATGLEVRCSVTTFAGFPAVERVLQFRNGGQELVIEQIQAAMLCFGMVPVGGHAPEFQGATLLSAKDSIAQDDLGLKTAAQLGKHVGEAAIKLSKGS